MVQDFHPDDFNLLYNKAKKVLLALSQFENGLLVKGELIQKKTGLLTEEINDDVKSLKKSHGELNRRLNKFTALQLFRG